MSRLLNRGEVKREITECLEEADNVTLEDVFNLLCTDGKGKFPISYDQNDIFIVEVK